MKSRDLIVVTFLAGALFGVAVMTFLPFGGEDDVAVDTALTDSGPPVPAPDIAAEPSLPPTSIPSASEEPMPTPPAPEVGAVEGSPTTQAVPPVAAARDVPEWLAIADTLAPTIRQPSDCGIPFQEPASLPNSPREYRGGTHAGIDFICSETGRSAVAALPGSVVMAMGSWTEPSPADRGAVLATATGLGRTPPWILAFLYGRFVVLDHGVIPGVGHVTTVSAHLAELHPAIRQGIEVPAGTVLGEIGNAGTNAAATGEDRPRSLHLHWEMYVDDAYLGQGASSADTATIYARLFGLGG